MLVNSCSEDGRLFQAPARCYHALYQVILSALWQCFILLSVEKLGTMIIFG